MEESVVKPFSLSLTLFAGYLFTWLSPYRRFQAENLRLPELEGGIGAFHTRDASEIYILAAFNNSTYRFDVRQIAGATG
jgi:hypothetical protein